MVFPEILHQISFQRFAQALINETEVLGLGGIAHQDAHEVGETVHGIVAEGTVARHQRNDAVIIHFEVAIGHQLTILLHAVALVGEDQAGLVDAVAAHHAPYGITD